MAHEVIMPALGMAQETGVLVRWLKAVGDQVTKGEPLIEVETDKAVQEVDAQASGTLANLSAEAGQEVPVGQVIGLILAEGEEAGEAAAAPVAEPVAKEEPAEAKPEPRTPERQMETVSDTGRILASPKARRLAAEQGLDLSRLVAAGHPQPYHVADLEALGSLPAEDGAEAKAEVATPARQAAGVPIGHLTAECDSTAFSGLKAQFARDARLEIGSEALFARYAAMAWRRATGSDADVVLAVERLAGAAFGPAKTYANPDRSRLTGGPVETEAAPTLVLRDLTGSKLTSMMPSAAADAPVLTVGDGGGGVFRIGLSFSGANLSDAQAVALLVEFAEALANPLVSLA